jgi:hypothetical protein
MKLKEKNEFIIIIKKNLLQFYLIHYLHMNPWSCFVVKLGFSTFLYCII